MASRPSMSAARRQKIAGRQFNKCNNKPSGPRLRNLEDYICPIWGRSESPGSFDASGYIIDHIVPLAQTRDDSDKNLQALCHSCSAAKTKADNDESRGIRVERREDEKKQSADVLERKKAELILVLERNTLEAGRMMIEAKVEADRITAEALKKADAIMIEAKRVGEIAVTETRVAISVIETQLNWITISTKDNAISVVEEGKDVLVAQSERRGDKKTPHLIREQLSRCIRGHLISIASKLLYWLSRCSSLSDELRTIIGKPIVEMKLPDELRKCILGIFENSSITVRETLECFSFSELKPLCAEYKLSKGGGQVDLINRLVSPLQISGIHPLTIMMMIVELVRPKMNVKTVYDRLEILDLDNLKQICKMFKVHQERTKDELVGSLDAVISSMAIPSILALLIVEELKLLCACSNTPKSGTKSEIVSRLSTTDIDPMSIIGVRVAIYERDVLEPLKSQR